MTDERNPNGNVRQWSPLVETFRTALMAEHSDDWDMDTVAEAAYICASALTAAGFVVVRAPGLNHGDELGQYTGDGRSHPRDVFVRRPVPEPATRPCATCDGMGDIAVEFGETPLDYTTAPCPTCGGSGVATTEGNQQ